MQIPKIVPMFFSQNWKFHKMYRQLFQKTCNYENFIGKYLKKWNFFKLDIEKFRKIIRFETRTDNLFFLCGEKNLENKFKKNSES